MQHIQFRIFLYFCGSLQFFGAVFLNDKTDFSWSMKCFRCSGFCSDLWVFNSEGSSNYPMRQAWINCTQEWLTDWQEQSFFLTLLWSKCITGIFLSETSTSGLCVSQASCILFLNVQASHTSVLISLNSIKQLFSVLNPCALQKTKTISSTHPLHI